MSLTSSLTRVPSDERLSFAVDHFTGSDQKHKGELLADTGVLMRHPAAGIVLVVRPS
jgi:hypothetical protein